jgi:PAS domain S-box-containing protein
MNRFRLQDIDRRALLGGFSITLAAMLWLLGYLIWSGYREGIAAAGTTTNNYAAVLETRLEATLRRADADLRHLAAVIPPAALSQTAVARHAAKLDAELDARLVNFPEVGAMRVFDAAGTLLYTSGRATAPPAHGGDRAYFHALRDDPRRDVVLSEVIIGRTSKQTLVVMARALRDAQGVFHGIVYATLDIDYFEKLFSTLDVGPRGVIAIYRSDDFSRVARWPRSAGEQLNPKLPPDSPTRAALPPGTAQATLELTSAADGLTRIYSYHTLCDYPFFVSVGIARADALAAWRGRSLAVGVAGLLFTGLLGGLLNLLLRAQDRNRENEQVMRSTFEQAAVGIAHIAPDTFRALRLNEQYCRLLGYAPAELIGRDLHELVPDDERGARAGDRQRLEAGEVGQLFRDTRFIRKDGSELWVNRGLSLVRDADGKPLYFISVIKDISARRQAEEARRYLASIVAGSSDAIIGFTLDRRITSWNPAAERMFGYPAAEAIGQQVTMLIPPELAHESARNRELLLAGRPVTGYETVRMARDGSRVSVSMSQSPILDEGGTLAGVALIFRDISAQQADRQLIRDLKDRMAAIIDASQDAIISIGEDERILIFSSAAERLFGVTAADAMGQTIDRFIPARFRGGHHAHLGAFRDSGVTVRGMGQFSRVSALKANGDEFPIEASISHILIGGKHIFTVTIRDISERERAAALHTSLEAQLRESQKMEAIGTLAGGIAHDFNNIIATILGNTKLAGEDLAGRPEAQQSLDEIRRAASRARDLVRQILSFSRRQSTERKLIAVAPVIEEAARLLRATLPARVTLAVDCDPAVPPVLADATQIQQVLINLATNAMQAMPERAGHITLRLDSVVLDAALAGRHPRLREMHEKRITRLARLAVCDNGVGMDEATRARIFEPFFTTKPVDQGTGLGLAVVHGIVQSHDGAIVVDSVPNRGTTFTLYLPAAGEVAAAAAPVVAGGGKPAAGAMGGGRHILYLDDEEALVFLLKRLLTRRGFRVSAFARQDEALAALRAAPADFDLVVTDYNMPGMSGLDVARAVHEIRADLPVAIASGFIDETLQAQAGGAGVRELIFKAHEVEDLCTAIARLAT